MTMKAQLNWTEGFQFIGKPENGPAVIMDTPQSGSGASPMQFLLMGMAGCSAMDVVSILEKKKADVSNLKINIEGDQAETHPRKFTHIRMEFVVYGKGIKEKDVERSIELSVTKYCSVMASVNAEVSHSFKIIEID